MQCKPKQVLTLFNIFMAMQTKENEIFKQMLDWIYANTEARNQADVARKSGLFEATISRALNGKIKRVKQETLRKVNSAFGNVFNPAWLRGDSDIMLVADLAEDKSNDLIKTVSSISPSSTDTPTTSSLINATLAAKDETIMSLKRELSAKDDLIAALREQQSDKDNLIADKERYILDLKQQLFALRNYSPQENPQKGFSRGYSYPLGVAERERGVAEP